MRSATHTVTWTCHGSCDNKGTESQGVCNDAMLQAAARLCSPGVFRDLEQQPAKVVVGWALQGVGAAITICHSVWLGNSTSDASTNHPVLLRN